MSGDSPGQGDRLPTYTNVTATNPSVLHELHRDVLGRVGPNRETNALSRQNYGGVHSDHIAIRRHEWAAGIARIESRISLNDVFDEAACPSTKGSAQRTHHPCRHRGLKSIRIADRHHELTDSDSLRISQ